MIPFGGKVRANFAKVLLCFLSPFSFSHLLLDYLVPRSRRSFPATVCIILEMSPCYSSTYPGFKTLFRSWLFCDVHTIGLTLYCATLWFSITQYCHWLFPLVLIWLVKQIVSACLCSGCYNKNTIDWVTETANLCFTQFWRLRCPRSRSQQIWCLMRPHFLIHSYLLSVFSLDKGVRDLSGVS